MGTDTANGRMELFKQRTRTRLAYLGLTHADLARRLEMSRQQLQGWLTRADIKLGHIERIAEALGVSTAFLIDADAVLWDELLHAAPAWVGEMEAAA